MDEEIQWQLLKRDEDEVYGPLTTKQIKEWAYSAFVAPMDRVSSDGGDSWVRAPMIRELEMDWLIEVTADHLYGPTTLGAIQEFLDAEEINENTRLINCVDGTSTTIGDLGHIETDDDQLELEIAGETGADGEDKEEPARASIKVSLQKKVMDLESSLLDERRALQMAEESYRRLEDRYQTLRKAYKEATGKDPEG